MLTLTPAETSWLHAYQKLLDTEFPDCMEDLSIFGSKARGDARAVPSLHVYTVAEWEQLRKQASVFQEIVERDRVDEG